MTDPIIVTQEAHGDPSAAPEFTVSLWDGDTPEEIQIVIHVKQGLSAERKASPALLTGLAFMIAEQQGVLNKLVESVFPLGPPTEQAVETFLSMFIEGDDVQH